MSKFGKVRPAELALARTIDPPRTPLDCQLSSRTSNESQRSFTPPRSSKERPAVLDMLSGPRHHRTTQHPKNDLQLRQKFGNGFLDAIYFVCPDFSYYQCSAIIGGLLTAVMLTLFFLYLGGYWQSQTNGKTNLYWLFLLLIISWLNEQQLTLQSNHVNWLLLRSCLDGLWKRLFLPIARVQSSSNDD